jgi:preprotein translocase subunit SecY
MDLEFLRPALKYLPEVRHPKRKLSFKEKLFWTSLVLLLFFLMGTIYPYGVSPELLEEKIQGFAQLQMIFASEMGTIVSLGIGPIVTASIILTLLQGAEMIKIDTTTQDGKVLFQGTQKILTVLIAIFEAAALVIATKMVSGSVLIAFTVFQIALGSILLMFMDELVSKWGIGSGISLFIAAGVSQVILVSSLNFLSTIADDPFAAIRGDGTFAGILPNFMQQVMAGNFNPMIVASLVATIIVFLVVVFGESMRIEIPLTHANIRGYVGRFPLKFFYVSNMPVILTAALLSNVQLWANFAGVDVNNPSPDMSALQKVVYYISSNLTLGRLHGILVPERWGELANASVITHFAIYASGFIALCIVFGKFWVEMQGLNSEGVAKQIEDIGMQRPGFRRDRRIIQSMLDRYIPQITIISSIAVGMLAVGSDLLGAIGSGTGILLTVGIIYRFYEDIKREDMTEMPAGFRQFMGKE